MHPLRSIPRPQFVFAATASGPLTCGRCGEEYQRARPGQPVGIWPGLHHVLDNGSGEIDEELDRDHRPVVGDYHEDDERDES